MKLQNKDTFAILPKGLRYKSRKSPNIKKTIGLDSPIKSVFDYVCHQLDCDPSFVRTKLVQESVLSDQRYMRFEDDKHEFLANLFNEFGRRDPYASTINGLTVNLKDRDLDQAAELYDFCKDNDIKSINGVFDVKIGDSDYICVVDNSSSPKIIYDEKILVISSYLRTTFKDVSEHAWAHHTLKAFKEGLHSGLSNAESLKRLGLSVDENHEVKLYEESSIEPFLAFPEFNDETHRLAHILINHLHDYSCHADIVFKDDGEMQCYNVNGYTNTSEEIRYQQHTNAPYMDAYQFEGKKIRSTFEMELSKSIEIIPHDADFNHIFTNTPKATGLIGDELIFDFTLSDTFLFRDILVRTKMMPSFSSCNTRLVRHPYNFIEIEFDISITEDSAMLESDSLDDSREVIFKHIVYRYLETVYLYNTLPPSRVAIILPEQYKHALRELIGEYTVDDVEKIIDQEDSLYKYSLRSLVIR